MNCTRALGRPISLISLSPALVLSNSGWPRANCAHPRRLRNQQLTLSLQQMQQLRQLGAASCFDTFWAQQKLCPKVGSAQKMKSLKENRTKRLLLLLLLRLRGGGTQFLGMCWNAALIKEPSSTFAAQNDQFFLFFTPLLAFYLIDVLRCPLARPGLAWPGLLLLVCRSLRYYFAIHFCLTQFQFQFSFSFSSSCLHFIIIWIHSWQKRNEMKRNETLQCKLNADAGNFLLTFSSFLFSLSLSCFFG